MATGDLRNNLVKILSELKNLKYSGPNWDIAAATKGDPIAFLPLFHYILVDYSPSISKYLASRQHVLSSKKDARFVEAVYKLLRDEFGYKPALTKEQFLGMGFAERKCIFVMDVARMVKELEREMDGRRRRVGGAAGARRSSRSGGGEASRGSASGTVGKVWRPASSMEERTAVAITASGDRKEYMSDPEIWDEDEDKNNGKETGSDDEMEGSSGILGSTGRPMPPDISNIRGEGITLEDVGVHRQDVGFRDTGPKRQRLFEVDEELEAAIYAENSTIILHHPTGPPPQPMDQVSSVNVSKADLDAPPPSSGFLLQDDIEMQFRRRFGEMSDGQNIPRVNDRSIADTAKQMRGVSSFTRTGWPAQGQRDDGSEWRKNAGRSVNGMAGLATVTDKLGRDILSHFAPSRSTTAPSLGERANYCSIGDQNELRSRNLSVNRRSAQTNAIISPDDVTTNPPLTSSSTNNRNIRQSLLVNQRAGVNDLPNRETWSQSLTEHSNRNNTPAENLFASSLSRSWKDNTASTIHQRPSKEENLGLPDVGSISAVEHATAMAVIERMEKLFHSHSTIGESLTVRLEHLEMVMTDLTTSVYERLAKLEVGNSSNIGHNASGFQDTVAAAGSQCSGTKYADMGGGDSVGEKLHSGQVEGYIRSVEEQMRRTADYVKSKSVRVISVPR